MKILGIFIARLDSSRLPGKALLDFGKYKLIEWGFVKIKKFNKIIPLIATTNRTLDDPLCELAVKYGIPVVRGDVNNIAGRVVSCLNTFSSDAFVRLNADSPYFQIDLIEKAIHIMENNDFDFVTNLICRTFPYGISIELIKSDVFKEAYAMFNESHREHIMSYFYQKIKDYSYYSIKNEFDLSRLRLTVDEPIDAQKFHQALKIHPDLPFQNLETITNVYSKLL